MSKDDNNIYLSKYKKPKVRITRRKPLYVKNRIPVISSKVFIQSNFRSFMGHVLEYSGIEHI